MDSRNPSGCFQWWMGHVALGNERRGQQSWPRGLWGPQHCGRRPVWTDFTVLQGVVALRATDMCPPRSVSPGLARPEEAPQKQSRGCCWGTEVRLLSSPSNKAWSSLT